MGVERYEIVATLDMRTSEICQELDGEVFEMKSFEPGVTAPPFHPWCRTVTCPYFDDNFGERAARGADGKTCYVPGDMKYGELYGKHVLKDSGWRSIIVVKTNDGLVIENIKGHLLERGAERVVLVDAVADRAQKSDPCNRCQV